VFLGTILTVMALRQVGLHYSRRVAADLWRFGVPLIATQGATFVLTFGDRYFLRAVTTLDAVGRYTLAYQFAFLLAVLAQAPFDMVWGPKRYEVATQPNRDVVYARMFVYLNVVLMTAAVGISLFVHAILQVMTPVAFWPAAHVVPVLLVAIVLQTWTASQDIGITITERTKWIAAANWVGAAVVLAAYAVLVPPFAAWGAAIATVIGYAVRYAAIYVASQRLWPVRYDWQPVRRLCVLAVVVVLIGTAVPYGPLALAIAARVALFAVYLLIVWRSSILADSDRRAVRQAIAQLFELLAGRLRLGSELPRGVS
jgi:O-antigen/teichoic acid export membrane protein